MIRPVREKYRALVELASTWTDSPRCQLCGNPILSVAEARLYEAADGPKLLHVTGCLAEVFLRDSGFVPTTINAGAMSRAAEE